MALGESGEELAAHYLRKKKYRIIKRNFRTKIGEVDIIARQGRTLVFCEVKTRLNRAYGQPFEAVTPRKQHTIRKVAEFYMAMAVHSSEYDSVRFDVISVLAEGRSLDITHIENAEMFRPDLIVIGNSEKSGIRRTLGSIVDAVMKGTDIPVLVITDR